MCGICGFYGFEDRELLRRMTFILKHRGPDDSGFFHDRDVSLGHRRLSIIDLKTGKQPMFNEDSSVCIVFNGEIYNHQSMREDLEKKGHRFSTNSDTESIIHAYEEYGHNCLEKLRGMFAFAIWDSGKKELFLARDHIGIKPLFYFFDEDKLIFASEIKAILAAVQRGMNMKALDDYLTFGFSRGEDTIFDGIKKLLPGHYLMFNGRMLKKRYWDFHMLGIDKYIASAVTNFRETFTDSLRHRMIADVPLGVFLSGGIDSSAIVAYMSRMTNEPIRTFSVGFNQETDELKYARRISEKFSTDHTEKIVDYGDVPKLIEKVVWHMDDPMSDPAILPTYLISKVAATKVKVVLTGEGADELFGGYIRYNYLVGKYGYLPSVVRSKAYGYQMTLFRDRDKKKLFGESLSIGKIASNLNQAIDFELRNSIPDQMLVKVDRATMAASIEARVPFLDKDMIKLSSRMHPSLKIRRGEGKFVVKKALEGTLPKEIIYRKKHGFSVPLVQWFTGELRDYASQILLDSETNKNFGFNDYRIRKILPGPNGFRRSGDAFRVWRLLVLGQFQKLYDL